MPDKQMIPKKRCLACDQEKLATTEFFHARPLYASPDGLHNWCKVCRQELRKHPKKQRQVSLEDYRWTKLGVEVPLTKEKYTLVDECDLDLFDGCKWTYMDRDTKNAKKKRYTEESGCAKRFILINGKKTHIRLHRVILERKLGYPIPEGYVADHVNGNPLDNRRVNLRLATSTQNAHNSVRQGRGSNPYKGVSLCKDPWRIKKWTAQIFTNGHHIRLGHFLTAEEAALAYNEAALKHYGEFAKLNNFTSEDRALGA